jgi:hypothetical protein
MLTRSYGRDTNLLLIENIPVISCLIVERVIDCETLHEIERIKLHAEFAHERPVPVAAFG